MTISIAIQTRANLMALQLTIPAYKPSSLLAVIMALAIAVAGLAVDNLLAVGPLGAVALPFVATALGMILTLLAMELQQWNQNSSLNHAI